MTPTALCKRVYLTVYCETGFSRAKNWSHLLARITKLWHHRKSVSYCVLHFKPKKVKLSIYIIHDDK